MFRFLFRTLFRFVRLVFRVGLLTGLGFAAVKLVQSRRESSLGGGADWSAARPRRAEAPRRPGGETPLVEPDMLHGVSLKRAEEPGPHDGQRGTGAAATTAAAPAPTQAIKPTAPAQTVAEAPRAAAPGRTAKAAKKGAVRKQVAKKAVAKKAAAKKAAVKKVTAVKKAATKKVAARRAAVKKTAVKKATAKRAVKKAAGAAAPTSEGTPPNSPVRGGNA